MRTCHKLLISVGAAALVVGCWTAAWATTDSGSRPPATAHPHTAAPLAGIDTSTASSYTPIHQCRVVDTRASNSGKVVANTVRSWHVSGTAGFPGQGGANGGCGVPASATAVTAVIQSISASGNGDLHLWPFGSSEPQKIFFNFTNVTSVSQTVTFQINTSGANDISVRAEKQSTQLVIDVTGYYVKPMYARVAIDGSLIAGSRVTGTRAFPTGGYQVNFDRDVSACEYNATSASFPTAKIIVSSGGGTVPLNPDAVSVFIENATGVPVNGAFQLSVTC